PADRRARFVPRVRRSRWWHCAPAPRAERPAHRGPPTAHAPRAAAIPFSSPASFPSRIASCPPAILAPAPQVLGASDLVASDSGLGLAGSPASVGVVLGVVSFAPPSDASLDDLSPSSPGTR